MSVLLGSAHWDWTKRPTGVWDRRAPGLAHPRAVFPPVQCMVVNAVGGRVEDVVAVDFDADRVCVLSHRYEDGKKVFTCDPVTRRPVEEWVHVPGVTVRPLPAELLLEQERKALARKGYKREADGTISTGHPTADA